MSQQSYEIVSNPRHLRYLFLIEIGYEGSKMIALMHHLMDFWGGRLSPIVPVNGNAITEEWKKIIAAYDPDYVCRSNNVSEEFALFVCTELWLNPIEIINIDDRLHEIKGVQSQNLIPVLDMYFEMKQTFLQSRTLWQVQSPLIDYYKLNYLLKDNYVISGDVLGHHEIAIITPVEFQDINKIIVEKRVYNNTMLSSINSNTTILRAKDYNFLFFELIIVSNYDSINDLIYHWNKRLYAPRNFTFSSLLITLEQLDLLVGDPNFGLLLDSLPGEYNQINLVSFSLKEPELQERAKQIQKLTKRHRIEVPKQFAFPFELLDARKMYLDDIKEKPAVQIIPSNSHLLYQAPLSFGSSFRSNNQRWCIDVNISEIEGMKMAKKFPLNTQSLHITKGQTSRIDRSRQLIVINSHDKQSPWTINIPKFRDIVRQVVTSPRLINEPDRYLYSHCAFNDSGNRLRQFVKLFEDNFFFIEEFVFDKFWSDIFHELTNNAKVEGDTITFNEIIEKCILVFAEVGGLKPRSESVKNEDNLRKGVKRTLQRLVTSKIFLPGFVIKCTTCSSKIWYSLRETDIAILCKGCSNKNHFQSELPISYKLNHLIKNNIGMRSEKGVFSPDGNLTAIKTLLYLNGKAYNSFEYIPQIDIYRNYEDEKPVTDLDIICLVNGELYIGECKFNSRLFFDNSNKSLNNLISIASTVRPDYIILSCSIDESGKLSKARQYIEHNVRKFEGRPKVIAHLNREPDYFELSGGHNYFLY